MSLLYLHVHMFSCVSALYHNVCHGHSASVNTDRSSPRQSSSSHRESGSEHRHKRRAPSPAPERERSASVCHVVSMPALFHLLDIKTAEWKTVDSRHLACLFAGVCMCVCTLSY